MAISWDCPFCGRVATIDGANVSTAGLEFNDGNKDGDLNFKMETTTCPNPQCREYTICARLYKKTIVNGRNSNSILLDSWQLRPKSGARPFPDYIPAPLLEDYEEACLIRDLSPKASATLSRRCLQGMIRNFYGVQERTLFDEINAIKDRVDPAIWQAIDAVRSIGNIGDHMEKDINLVIDVDPDEAQALIRLIEVLFQEWYVARQQRADHLASIVAIADAKKSQKAQAPQS